MSENDVFPKNGVDVDVEAVRNGIVDKKAEVIKRHQSLPTILRCSKNREGPIKGPSTPQKTLTSYYSTGQNATVVKAVPKLRLDASPPRPTARASSPPSPKKATDDKENQKKNNRGRAKHVVAGKSNAGVAATNKLTEKSKPPKGTNKTSDGQPKLTAFFPIRRSERRPKHESEAAQQKLIEERLIVDNDKGLNLEIRDIPEKGRGIFATQDFCKGDFIVEYAGDLINIKEAKEREGEYSMDLSKGCYMYYFRANNKQYCIDATKETGRLGRLINHSRQTPNLRTKVVVLRETPRLILIAKRDVKAGEELLYDYGDRSKQSLEAHPWLAC